MKRTRSTVLVDDASTSKRNTLSNFRGQRGVPPTNKSYAAYKINIRVFDSHIRIFTFVFLLKLPNLEVALQAGEVSLNLYKGSSALTVPRTKDISTSSSTCCLTCPSFILSWRRFHA